MLLLFNKCGGESQCPFARIAAALRKTSSFNLYFIAIPRNGYLRGGSGAKHNSVLSHWAGGCVIHEFKVFEKHHHKNGPNACSIIGLEEENGDAWWKPVRSKWVVTRFDSTWKLSCTVRLVAHRRTKKLHPAYVVIFFKEKGLFFLL